METSPTEIAVLGCGALGLTAARLAQQAGAKVTIYARDLLPDTRSSRATGTWTPDSRIALASKVAPQFPANWEEMARISWHTYRSYLGLPGEPVEWRDRYVVSDTPGGSAGGDDPPGGLDFAYFRNRIADQAPKYELLPAGSAPFPGLAVRRGTELVYNIADYGHTLMTDFLVAGGRIVRREFHSPAELGELRETVVINCPGYGARSLWQDESITPVRGQIAWLVPQPELDYGVLGRGVNMVSRRDGIVMQLLEGGDMRGYGDANEAPDRAEAKEAIDRMAGLYKSFSPVSGLRKG